jgi:hypothetical protein
VAAPPLFLGGIFDDDDVPTSPPLAGLLVVVVDTIFGCFSEIEMYRDDR